MSREVKTTWYLQDRHTAIQTRSENLEINCQICGQLAFNKGAFTTQWGKEPSADSGGPPGEARREEPGCAPGSSQGPTAPQSEALSVTKPVERNELHDIDYAGIWHQTFK